MSNHTRNHTRKPHPLDSLLGRGNYKLIAQSTGYTRQHISRVLRGMSGVSPICADMICSAAGVTREELLGYISTKCGYKTKTAASRNRTAISNRNRDIVSMADTANIEEISAKFGISRQQVSQILRYNAAEL